MKYIRSFYLALALIMFSGSVYAFVEDNQSKAHRNLGYHRSSGGGNFTSGSPQLW